MIESFPPRFDLRLLSSAAFDNPRKNQHVEIFHQTNLASWNLGICFQVFSLPSIGGIKTVVFSLQRSINGTNRHFRGNSASSSTLNRPLQGGSGIHERQGCSQNLR